MMTMTTTTTHVEVISQVGIKYGASNLTLVGGEALVAPRIDMASDRLYP